MPPPQNQYAEEELAQFKKEMDEAALLPLPDSSSSPSPGTKGKDTEEENHEDVGELARNEITGHTIYDHGGPGPINPFAHPFPDNGNNVEGEGEEEEEERPLLERYREKMAAVRECQGLDGEDEDLSPSITHFNKPELENEEDKNEEEEEVQVYYTTPDGRLERATLAPGYAVRPAGISIEEYYKNEMLGTGCGRAVDSDDDLDL
jgi:hypothetical protein